MPRSNAVLPRMIVGLLIAFAALVAVALNGSPARADDLPPLQRAAELNAPYSRCGTATCTVYLDRSTSKYFADRLDTSGLGNERVTGAGRELLCAVFGSKIGGACGLLDALIGTSFLDAVQQAESIDGCVTFKHVRRSTILSTYNISATNSKYCRD